MRWMRPLLVLAGLIGGADHLCHAAPKYTLTDLGSSPNDGLATFDANGGVNPTLQPQLTITHAQAQASCVCSSTIYCMSDGRPLLHRAPSRRNHKPPTRRALPFQ